MLRSFYLGVGLGLTLVISGCGGGTVGAAGDAGSAGDAQAALVLGTITLNQKGQYYRLSRDIVTLLHQTAQHYRDQNVVFIHSPSPDARVWHLLFQREV